MITIKRIFPILISALVLATKVNSAIYAVRSEKKLYEVEFYRYEQNSKPVQIGVTKIRYFGPEDSIFVNSTLSRVLVASSNSDSHKNYLDWYEPKSRWSSRIELSAELIDAKIVNGIVYGLLGDIVDQLKVVRLGREGLESVIASTINGDFEGLEHFPEPAIHQECEEKNSPDVALYEQSGLTPSWIRVFGAGRLGTPLGNCLDINNYAYVKQTTTDGYGRIIIVREKNSAIEVLAKKIVRMALSNYELTVQTDEELIVFDTKGSVLARIPNGILCASLE